MIKNLIRGFALTVMFASSTMTYAQSSSDLPAERVNCYCAFWGKNDDCLTTNGGNLCVADVDPNTLGACRAFDSNCA